MTHGEGAAVEVAVLDVGLDVGGRVQQFEVCRHVFPHDAYAGSLGHAHLLHILLLFLDDALCPRDHGADVGELLCLWHVEALPRVVAVHCGPNEVDLVEVISKQVGVGEQVDGKH